MATRGGAKGCLEELYADCMRKPHSDQISLRRLMINAGFRSFKKKANPARELLRTFSMQLAPSPHAALLSIPAVGGRDA